MSQTPRKPTLCLLVTAVGKGHMDAVVRPAQMVHGVAYRLGTKHRVHGDLNRFALLPVVRPGLELKDA